MDNTLEEFMLNIDNVDQFFNNISKYLTLHNIIKLLYIYFSILILVALFRFIKKLSIEAKIDKLANNALEMTPEEFMKMRSTSFGGRGRPSYALTKNFAGVYILHNKTQDKYYVGQGKQVLNRVNNHFTGRGNGDVYADYKYGNEFTIKMIALENSKFKTLNELERHTIARYNAFSKGYNKTRGNKN